MDTTIQHPAHGSVDWIAHMRAAAVGAVTLALIVASMVAWAAILNWSFSTHP
jgi:hypothetical protein